MANSFKGTTLLWLLAALVLPLALGGAFYRIGVHIPFPGMFVTIPVWLYFAYQSYRRADVARTSNTLKPAVYLWVLGAFPLWFIVMRFADGMSFPLPPLLGFLVVLAMCCGFANRAYKSGQDALGRDINPVTIKPACVVASLAGLAVIIGATWYTTRPTIEGKYRASSGGEVEFLSDGTVIFTVDQKKGFWTWTEISESRLKLDPGANLVGRKPTVCDYAFMKNGISLKNCDFALNLTRQSK